MGPNETKALEARVKKYEAYSTNSLQRILESLQTHLDSYKTSSSRRAGIKYRMKSIREILTRRLISGRQSKTSN